MEVRYHLCAFEVVFDIWHTSLWSSRKFHNWARWESAWTDCVVSMAWRWVVAQEGGLLVLCLDWSLLPLVQSQVAFQ